MGDTNVSVTNDMKVIVFRLKDEEYGVDVNQVKSIERMQTITRIPATLDFLKGVINSRGSIIPVIDLRTRFDIEAVADAEHTRIIIVGIGNMEIGVIVDEANDVIDISADAIAPPPAVIGAGENEYIRGIAKVNERLLILLDMDKVVNSREMKILQNIGAEDNGLH